MSVAGDDFDRCLDRAVIACRETGALLVERMPADGGLGAEERSRLRSEVDQAAGRLLHDSIAAAFPDHRYVSVGTANRTFFESGFLWVLDPVVGLGNLTHGDPYFAVSAALMLDGRTVAGVVYSPAFDQLFTAVRGCGASLNGKPITVSRTADLESSLLATRFPYDIRDGEVTNLEIFNHLILRAEGVRNNGTATLDLAYVACGKYDGFWALHMHPWDLAAAVLLVEEAAGKVTTLSGEDYFIESRDVLGTNGRIHERVLEVIADAPR